MSGKETIENEMGNGDREVFRKRENLGGKSKEKNGEELGKCI